MGLFDIFKAIAKTVKNNNFNLPDTDQSSPPNKIPIESNTERKYSYHIGDLAKKYETSGKGPGYISNGSNWGDPGGDSYGSYQIETKKGTMKEYLTKTNDMFTKELSQFAINSDKFKQTWKDLASKYPEQFQQSQFDFLCKKPNGYNDAIAYAKKLGWATDNLAMQSAIFSISNQSGGWKLGIFVKTGIKSTDSIDIQINKLYDSRATYFKSLGSLSYKIKESIMKNRCGKKFNMENFIGPNERKDCLKLI